MKLGPIEDLDAWAEEAKEKIDGRTLVASVSGGKDSTAMALLFRAAKIPFIAVNMDTGWEHADTDHYVREILPKYIGPIKTITAEIEPKPEAAEDIARLEKKVGRESAMLRLVLNRGYFPSRKARFCTQEIKMDVMRKWLDELDSEPINATGVRASESAKRSKYPEWERWEAADCDQWRPLIRWSDQDVVNIHKEFQVPPNPLYLRGAHRVGCWPCIYARKSEIRNIAETDPDRIDLMEELEQIVTLKVREKVIARGEVVKTAHSGWFWNGSAGKHSDGRRRGEAWKIRDVVEWSKTSYGGKQYELFAPPDQEFGCMRWGVCDTGAQDKE